MNIFFLDSNPKVAAQLLCDKHIVKMPLETAQMLCTAYDRHGETAPYKSTHKNHPSTLWAGQTIENYRWLWKHGMALCEEYTYRYDKRHACEDILLVVQCPPIALTARGFTKMPQAMPEEYKQQESTEAYKAYYRGQKAQIATWRKRPIPAFMEDVINVDKT